ncbi:hypothetical protein OE88DRAFT_909534 [Heliocybe sulcata]|uniref:Uncharacterized protein n=1 Tax=Heliocybe sulcata TaxID=5364 RepID=A0A5C3MPA6_9AGAM|nr:hypothetical protein OE88DRAFT_909534 [Heliocybe sulcata]
MLAASGSSKSLFLRYTLFLYAVPSIITHDFPPLIYKRARRRSLRHPSRPDLETEYARAHPLSMVASALATPGTMKNPNSRKTANLQVYRAVAPPPSPLLLHKHENKNAYASSTWTFILARSMKSIPTPVISQKMADAILTSRSSVATTDAYRRRPPPLTPKQESVRRLYFDV